jgi:hypothetical protein
MFIRKRTADDEAATAAAAVAAEAAAGVKTKRKQLGITAIDEEAAAAAAQPQQLDLEPAAVTAAALAADDEALAAADDDHEAHTTKNAIAKNKQKAVGSKPNRKRKRGFAGVRSTGGRAAGLPAGQPSAAAAAAAGQRPVTRRRPLSYAYDARKHNLSAPAPLPYFKPRVNSKFFVPEPGDDQQQEWAAY